MHPSLFALALVLYGPLAPAWAQAPDASAAVVPPEGAGAAVEAVVPAAAVVQAELRSEYILGEKLIVPVILRNSSESVVTVPDLATRPWLVTFHLRLPIGEKQRRRTAAPVTDPGRTIDLRPGESRRVLIEIPSGGALKAGDHQLGVSVEMGGKEPVLLESRTIRLAPARPVAGDVRRASAGRAQVSGLWLHGAAQGFDLYLHEADAKNPARALGDWFLVHLDQKATPWLAVSRGQDEPHRFVVWMRGGRGVQFIQLQGAAAPGGVQSVTLPWPKAEIAGTPALDGHGRLHVPLWVPGPKGSGGELRLLTVGERGRLAFPRLTALADRPVSLDVTVDDGGSVQALVILEDAVDLYTVRGEQLGDGSLPVPGRRIARADAGHKFVAAAFGALPEEGSTDGSLAVLTLQSGASGLKGRWVGLRGAALLDVAPLAWAPTDRVRGVLPDGRSAPGVVLQDGDGATLFRNATGTIPLPKGGTGTWGLLRATDGTALLRRLEANGPVGVTPLRVTP
jgi:hypothetical protein